MKNIFLLILIFILSWTVNAKTLYVTDSLDLTLRNGKSNRHKIVKMLRSGTRLSVIERDTASGYIKVRLKTGVEGYILASHTQKNPIDKWVLKQTNKQLELLKAENSKFKTELGGLRGENSENITERKSMGLELEQLGKELNDLRQTAANVIQLKNQRDHLQERVVNVERELQQIKLENKALEDSTNQDWFLYGGILSFIGIFLGWLIPKISWQRKTSNWDTF